MQLIKQVIINNYFKSMVGRESPASAVVYPFKGDGLVVAALIFVPTAKNRKLFRPFFVIPIWNLLLIKSELSFLLILGGKKWKRFYRLKV